MRRLSSLVGLLALLTLGAAPAVPTPNVTVKADPVPGRYIVVLRQDAARWGGEAPGTKPSVKEVATELALLYGGTVDFVYEFALLGFALEASEAQAAALSTDSRIEYVEQDGHVVTLATQYDPPWGLDRIDQRDLPLSNTYTFHTTGRGVRAYVLDTGIRYSHQEIRNRVERGFDALLDLPTADDCHGHGTHVAGIIGGVTYGVAKGVTLVPVRVFACLENKPTGLVSVLIRGIDWITADHDPGEPAVANLSVTAKELSPSLDQSVLNAIADGITFVAAAQQTTDACNASPANRDEVIVVGATSIETDAGGTPRDRRLYVCSPCTDWYAPGYEIPSADWLTDSATLKRSGTSMAAAHATGVVALFLERHPNASPAFVKEHLTNNNAPDKVECSNVGTRPLLQTPF